MLGCHSEIHGQTPAYLTYMHTRKQGNCNVNIELGFPALFVKTNIFTYPGVVTALLEYIDLLYLFTMFPYVPSQTLLVVLALCLVLLAAYCA